MVLQFEDSNPLLPRFTYLEGLKDVLAKPWMDAIVAKSFGQNVSVGPIEKRVRELWKPNGEMDLFSLSFGYILIKFDNDADRDKVLLGGPWTV